MSGLRWPRRLAHGTSTVDVCGVRSKDLADRRDDFSPVAHPAVDLVRRGLVRHLAEERGVRAGASAGSGFRLLRNRVGVVAQAGAGDDSPRPGPPARSRRARRDLPGGVSPGQFGAGTGKPVQVAVERVGSRRLGRVRFAVASRPGTLELVEFACTTVEPGSVIRTDGARMLRRLTDRGYQHEHTTVYNSLDKAEELPGVHRVASLLKRWTAGTLHYSVSDQHLAYYLDEYAFRFNRRASSARGMLFYRLLQQAAATDPHPLHELTGP